MMQDYCNKSKHEEDFSLVRREDCSNNCVVHCREIVDTEEDFEGTAFKLRVEQRKDQGKTEST